MRIMTGADDEVELKLDVDLDVLDQIAAGPLLAGDGAPREQVSTYFDTPDQALRRAGVSLRVRRSGDRYVQTVKVGGSRAAGLFARPEWERQVAADAPELDGASPLRTLLPAEVLDGVAPAFTVVVNRRAWTLDHDDARIEIVADRGEVMAGDRRSSVAEIELELKDGAPAALFALARSLGESAPLRLGMLTKAERGYRLLDPLRPGGVKADPVDLAPGMTTAESFAVVVAACLRQFRLNEELLRRTPSPEVVHQARVGLRRLRSALSIYRPVVADDRYPALVEGLRWLAAMLGEARDLDVLLRRLGGVHADRLVAARAAAYAAALGALDSQRMRDLMLDLAEWTALGAWQTAPADPDLPAESAERFAVAVLDGLRRKLKRRGHRLAELDDHDRHRLRIQAKKLRYAAGFFEGLFPGKKARRRHKQFLAALEALQDDLGELNDLATGPLLLARHGLDDMAAADPDRRAALLDDAADAQAALVDAKRFWR